MTDGGWRMEEAEKKQERENVGIFSPKSYQLLIFELYF